LEEIKATALARLTVPVPAAVNNELVGIEEASRRLSMSKSYLYRNSNRFAFTRHVGRRLLFSTGGIDQYIKTRR
jgi:hypothetical protein